MSEEFIRKLIEGFQSALKEAYGEEYSTACPYCGAVKHIPAIINPVMVCVCRQCEGYMCPFAGQLLPLSKSVIENGNEQDRRFEVVSAIMKMLHKCVRELVKKKISEEEGGEGGIKGGEMERGWDIPDGM